MSSTLECWNDALFLLELPRVSSTTPSNEATRLFNEAWYGVAQTCLEQGEWDFAKVRGELSRTTAPAFGYDYYYLVPSDSLRLVFVSETGEPNNPLLRYAHEGNKIATDAETVYAIWVSKTAIDTPGRWSASFARLVSANLAERGLKLNPGAAQRVADAIKKAKPAAEGVDAVQNPPAFRRSGRWASSIRGHSSREQDR